jgi:molecular chaperone DnaK (HSP70)
VQQRYIGVAAGEKASMEPKNTISQLKRLIGKSNGDSELAADVPTFSFQVQDGPEGVPQVNVQYLGEPRSFRPEQLLAALLGELKAIGEKDQGTKITDCVLGVPGFFTEQQRRAVLDAAHVAGLNILRLVHETTATALAFGIYKTDWTDKPQYFAFVDGGHASLQARGPRTAPVASRSGEAAPVHAPLLAATPGTPFRSAAPLSSCRSHALTPTVLTGGHRVIHQGWPQGPGLWL